MKEEIINFYNKHPFFSILISSLFLYILWIWLPLGVIHSWNEAYYLQRVTHLVDGGSFYDGIFDNPPLFFYTLTFLSKIFGVGEILFRFVIVFSTVITTVVLYHIMLLFTDKKTALSSMALYAFFPMNIIFAKIIQIDMFAIMLMTLTVYFSILGVKKQPKYFFIAGIFLGLTVFTKIPLGIIVIPILYYMYLNKINLKYYLILIIESIIIPLPWGLHVLMTNPSFLKSNAGSSTNYFGMGSMHSAAPYYQLAMTILAIATFIAILLFFYKNKPKTSEEKILALSTCLFSFFFVLLPNHEYYLLPVFVPLFIYIGINFKTKNKQKHLKKIIISFLIISIALLAIRPIYEINWKEPCGYVKENYDEDIVIFSSSPKVVEYYTNREVRWLHPDQKENITLQNSVVLFTRYDKTNLKSVGLLDFIEEKMVLVKNFEDKIYVYQYTDTN